MRRRHGGRLVAQPGPVPRCAIALPANAPPSGVVRFPRDDAALLFPMRSGVIRVVMRPSDWLVCYGPELLEIDRLDRSRL